MKCSSKTEVNNIYFRPVQNGHGNVDYIWKVYYRWLTNCNFFIVRLWVLKFCSLIFTNVVFQNKCFSLTISMTFLFAKTWIFCAFFSENRCKDYCSRTSQTSHNKMCNRIMRRKVAYLHPMMVTFWLLYHTMFLVCVFNVRLKINIRIKTDAVCSFNSLRILPLMLSGTHVLCVLILCKSFCTSGRDVGSAVFRVLVQSGCCLVVPQ